MESLGRSLQLQSIDLLCRILDLTTSHQAILEKLRQLDLQGWENFRAVAQEQRMMPLLYARLKPLFAETPIPSDFQNNLRDSYYTIAAKNTLKLHHAGILIRAIRAAGIDVIGLKGIYLVENLYQRIGCRSFSDIDILVRKEDLQATITILEKLGFQLSTYFAIGDGNLDIKHVPPMINANGLPIEIHWTILEEDEPFTINAQGLWQRAMPAKIAGIDALALSHEDLLLHLCLHLGYQHSWNIGLPGLYDIAKVLHHYKGQLDWTKLSAIAQAWGVERVTWMTLRLAQDLLGAEVPPAILMALKPATLEPWMLAEARADLLNRSSRPEPMTPDLAKLAAEQGLWRRLKILFSRVFLSKQTLARLYNVPPTSRRIYACYLRRFLDLLRQYGDTLKRSVKRNQALQSAAEKEISRQRLKAWLGKH